MLKPTIRTGKKGDFSDFEFVGAGLSTKETAYPFGFSHIVISGVYREWLKWENIQTATVLCSLCENARGLTRTARLLWFDSKSTGGSVVIVD